MELLRSCRRGGQSLSGVYGSGIAATQAASPCFMRSRALTVTMDLPRGVLGVPPPSLKTACRKSSVTRTGVAFW